MPSRREVKQQASAMQRDIRRMAQESTSASRELLPSLRELAQRYGISHSLAAQSLKALIEEGVVYSVPRVGIFAGRPAPTQDGVFLLQMPQLETSRHSSQIRIGFEERIAQLGGTSLTLSTHDVQTWHDSGRIPEVAGLFVFGPTGPEHFMHARRVRFRECSEGETNVDLVDFDNVRGGQQATQHLLDHGHTRIAFLALHGADNETGVFTWSKEREAGWRLALENGGYQTKGLAFRPRCTPASHDQKEAALQAAQQLLKDSEITAVVVTNSQATQSLFEALNQEKIPAQRWPAVVCFDSDEVNGRDGAAHITALRLPWEDVGRTAADLLWERSNGQIKESTIKRLVPMKLITRLSSSSNWTEVAPHFKNSAPP